jgi:hypothetical protein
VRGGEGGGGGEKGAEGGGEGREENDCYEITPYMITFMGVWEGVAKDFLKYC